MDFLDDLKMASRQKVAILIDEYDDPIVKRLTDPPKAYQFRLALRDFYIALKSSSDMIGHIFITGVSRFSQLSVFTDLNNPNDITFDREYAAICGLTAADLEDLLSDREERALELFIENDYLAPGSDGIALREMIRNWYDGYSWDGNTKVYNPWSLLSCLGKIKFLNYWYTTGTPSFLHLLDTKVLKDQDWISHIPSIQEDDAVIQDIANIPPEVLLLLSGYLSIKEVYVDGQTPHFRLEIPNLEVKASLWPLAMAKELVDDPISGLKWAIETVDCLFKRDARGIQEAFGSFLNHFTNPIFKTNEGQFNILFQVALEWAKKKYDSQQFTAQGILDIHVVGQKGEHFIIELKVYGDESQKTLDSPGTNLNASSIGPAKKREKPKPPPPPTSDEDKAKLRESMTPIATAALTQIREKYADKYMGEGKPIVMVALVIARRAFVLAKFEVIDPIKSVLD
jgi:hypothetical protein